MMALLTAHLLSVTKRKQGRLTVHVQVDQRESSIFLATHMAHRL